MLTDEDRYGPAFGGHSSYHSLASANRRFWELPHQTWLWPLLVREAVVTVALIDAGLLPLPPRCGQLARSLLERLKPTQGHFKAFL